MKENLIYQGIGQLGSKGALFVFLLIAARVLGTKEYGIFSFALSSCYIISIIMDFGLNHLSVKWLARGEKGKFYLAFKGRILTITIGFMVVLLGSLLLNPLFRGAFIILGISFCCASLLTFYYSYFRGRETMAWEATISIFQRILLLGLGILLYYYHKVSAVTAAYVFLLSNSIALLLAFSILAKFEANIFKNLIKGSMKGVLGVLREGMPLMIAGISWILYYRVDILMLTYFQELPEVGLYSAVYKLMEGTFLIPSVIMAATFPRLSQYGKAWGEKFRIFFTKLFLVLFSLAIIIFISVRELAPFLVESILGADYIKATAIFKILIISLFAVYPGHLVGQSLIALDAQTTYMYISIIGAALNIGLNLWLIPYYGSIGAAWATVITEMVVAGSCLIGVWQLQVTRNAPDGLRFKVG